MSRLSFGLAIDFGSDMEPVGRRIERLAPLFGIAQELGFESVSAGESYPTRGGYFHLPSPFLVLAAVAQHTSLRIGTGVTLLSAWNPLRLAYDAAILDEISGGRLFLGIAAGNPSTWKQFNTNPERLGIRLDETVQGLKALWRGENGFKGELVDLPGPIRPLPIQAGGPPIWWGGLVPGAARRAANFANGWIGSTNYRLTTAIAPQIKRYHDFLHGTGRDPVVALNRLTVVGETDAEARRDGSADIEATLQKYAAVGRLAGPDGEPLRAGGNPLIPEVDEEVILLGSPETINERLEAYVSRGVTHVQMRIGPSDLSQDAMLRTVTLVGEQVIPKWTT